MGLLAIITILMASVGFLTFGFQKTVCPAPPPTFKAGHVDNSSVVIHGYAYNMVAFNHPAVSPTFDGHTNPLKTAGFAVAGQDISFMFQEVNGTCTGIINTVSGSVIPAVNNNPQWYFPCNAFPQNGSLNANLTGYESAFQCHTTSKSRSQLSQLNIAGIVAYPWSDVTDGARNLAVFEG
jgi:chitin synthase